MAHYAKVVNNLVVQVIVAEHNDIVSGTFGDPDRYIQTSYNTIGGVHTSGGTPLRKNYAGVGFTYDATRDAFYGPKPYPSWTLNEATCLWNPPTAYPDDGKSYEWNESTTAWDLVHLVPQ